MTLFSKSREINFVNRILLHKHCLSPIASYDGTSIVVEGKDYRKKSLSKTIHVDGDASVTVDGLQARVSHAFVVSRAVAVHPALDKTIIAFTRGLLKSDF